MKVIAFHLPQYYPVPENDAWWGPGFTDWVNVARVRPRFRGHHQPQIPADLGFYDLRSEAARIAQADLARRFRVGAFCFYHYWFNGTAMLETPIVEMLRSGRPDFPFCLAWANENWTRSWDGLENEVLLRQDYAAYDPGAHVRWLAPFFRDPRCLRVHGKALFLVYNPSAFPRREETVVRWREEARREGINGLYLVSVLSHRNTLDSEAAQRAGFDASVEFYPDPRLRVRSRWVWPLGGLAGRAWNRGVKWLGLWKRLPFVPSARVLSYENLVEQALARAEPHATTFPCVMPSWDNSARRRTGATVIQNDDPALYGRWLQGALKRVERFGDDEQLVFVNAWNEWAEGCHLEPDRRHGLAFLEETRRVVESDAAANRAESIA